MFRIFSFLTKKRRIQHAGVYRLLQEKTHVPLICSVAPIPTVYKRRYLKGERLTTESGDVDFDVMTELIFADRNAFDEWMAVLAKPGVGARLVPDEEKFLNRTRTRAYVVEEHITQARFPIRYRDTDQAFS